MSTSKRVLGGGPILLLCGFPLWAADVALSSSTAGALPGCRPARARSAPPLKVHRLRHRLLRRLRNPLSPLQLLLRRPGCSF